MSITCYLSIMVDGVPQGNINLRLDQAVAPRATENFRTLCTGKMGFGYRGSYFTRVIPQFMLQGGKVTTDLNLTPKSIYGGYFEDENFILKHDKPYVLGMANNGPGTNGCEFYITTVSCKWLNNKSVVFGEVADVESKELVKRLEALGSYPDGETRQTICIYDCGEIVNPSN